MPTLANPFYLSLKAGLAVALALALVRFIEVRDLVSAAFVALACVSPTVVTGMRRGGEQLIASAIGGAVTLTFLALLPRGPLTLGLSVGLTTLAIHRAGFMRAYLVAGFTVIYLVVLPADTPGMALEQRLLSVAAGVFSATAVNVAVSATSYRSIFRRRLDIVRGVLLSCLERLAACAKDPARASEASRCLEPAFGVISQVELELLDAASEGRWRSRMSSELAALMTHTRTLGRLAHHAKELGLQVEERVTGTT